jgi:hypothetical protein
VCRLRDVGWRDRCRIGMVFGRAEILCRDGKRSKVDDRRDAQYVQRRTTTQQEDKFVLMSCSVRV